MQDPEPDNQTPEPAPDVAANGVTEPTPEPDGSAPESSEAVPAEAFKAPAFEPAAPEASQPVAGAGPSTDETIKETVEALVIAFILAFVFRAFVVEAFIIPTGSMAPTLLGEHITCACPSCGYVFDTSSSGRSDSGDNQKPFEAACPMCHFPVQVPGTTQPRAGDRILVDKFIYTFADPKRWDVVVFKNPQASNDDGTPGPRTNFIKRLIGLPGEQVYLLDGDVFIAPPGSAEFTVARKADPDVNPHWHRIQNAMWQPIYHSQYVPLVTGQPGSGLGTVDDVRDEDHAWDVPWVVAANNQGNWQLGSARHPKRFYRFEGGQGQIEFTFDPMGTGVSYDNSFAVYPYNHDSWGRSMHRREHEPIEDIRLAAAIKPEGDDIMVTLSTTARLDIPDNGTETLAVSIDSAGWVILIAPDRDEADRVLAEPARGPRLTPGVATEVELWVVDQQIMVWVAGELVITYPYDLTWQQVLDRPAPESLPQVAIGINSAKPVELYRVELDRDVYYSGRYSPSAGSIFRRQTGLGSGELAPPMVLREQTADHDAEFYVIGDNTPASEDGRLWTDVNGWVRLRYLGGDERTRVVPRSLMVGRAFFVYYPAPQPATRGGGGIIPDFGRMRFIH
ncbi:MAG: S26 family signal peptidase [Phycisphaerales bacterium JB063]